MHNHGVCKRCGCSMAVLDLMLEGYDLVCIRCGIREIVNRTLQEPPPCSQ